MAKYQIWIILSVLLFNLHLVILGNNYYLSSKTGNDNRNLHEAQSPFTPWKTISNLNKNFASMKAGDTIFFMPGETFKGTIKITQSGTLSHPIVLTTFFQNIESERKATIEYDFIDTLPPKMRCIINLFHVKYIEINNLCLTDNSMDILNHEVISNVGVGVLIKNCSQIKIKEITASLLGIGIIIIGDSNQVQNSVFFNERMVVNTKDFVHKGDDYGANGIVISGSDNQILGNTFKDCWATSFDFGYDGGAIEIFGILLNRNIIKDNTAVDCNGFIEIGSPHTAVAYDNVIENNLLINNGSDICLHNDEKTSLTIKNFQIKSNSFIETKEQLTNPGSVINYNYSSTPNTILLTNNNFWLETKISVKNKNKTADFQLSHENNRFHLNGGSVNFAIDHSETMLESRR